MRYLCLKGGQLQGPTYRPYGFLLNKFSSFFLKNPGTSSAPNMLVLYSVCYFNDSIGIFMRYLCLKIMSVFHITLMKAINNTLIIDKFLTPAFRIYIGYLFRFVCTDSAYHNHY